MTDHYILSISGDPIPEPDVMKWALWFEAHNADRQLARTELEDGIIVSTIFLGLDHSFGHGEPQTIRNDDFWRATGRNTRSLCDQASRS